MFGRDGPAAEMGEARERATMKAMESFIGRPPEQCPFGG
jgi:hypothetical protein